MKRFSILVAMVLAVVLSANLAQAHLLRGNCGCCDAVKACAPAACAAPAPAPATCACATCGNKCEKHCGVLAAMKERICEHKACRCVKAECKACAPATCAPVKACAPAAVVPAPQNNPYSGVLATNKAANQVVAEIAKWIIKN